MAEAEEKVTMMRPNDLCTAAFYGDVKKLKELLTVPEVEEEPAVLEPKDDPDFDPLAPADTDAEESAKDRAKRRQENEDVLLQRLTHAQCIVTRLSPVNIRTFGFSVAITETDLHCHVKFKPSAKSKDVASPLHWAVLGKEHTCIEFLVDQGAPYTRPTPELSVSVFDVCEANGLKETKKVLLKAIEARRQKVDSQKQKEEKRQAALDAREQARQKAADEVKRKEEEERLEAERQAAEEAAQQEKEEAGGGAQEEAQE